MTLSERICELLRAHGSLREVGCLLGIDYTYLYRMFSGEKLNPSEETLNKLGLRKIVSYERTKP